MSVTIDPKTGWPVKPQKRTVYVLVCWNAYCDSKSHLEDTDYQRLLERYEAGCEAHLYGSIYEEWERQGYDRQEMEAYEKAWSYIWYHSCLMPPEEDLRLLSWAKKLPPDRWQEIDPEAGKWAKTRQRLKEIRSELRWGNEKQPDPSRPGCENHKHLTA